MAENFINRRKELRGTASAWTSNNTVLLDGEWGIETDTGKAKIGDGSTAWNSLPYFGGSGTQDLEDVIAQDPVATSQPTFEGGIDMNGSTIQLSDVFGDVQFIDASAGDIEIGSDAYGVIVSADTGLYVNNGIYAQNNSGIRVNNAGDTGASLLKATNITTTRTHELPDKDGTFAMLSDIGSSTPTSAGDFSGEIDLTNRAGSFYNQYDLETDGQITFSLASSPLTFAYSYLVIDSDGVTEFATKPNLDAIFNEQYNIPTDRILSEGLHTLYILKTPTGAALSIPTNQYNPDIVAPTLSNYTIEDANPDRITFESSEVITGTTFGGFTLGSGKTVTGITINSGNTTGHYFTVSSAYTSGDGNDTIAYSGTGCNIQDLSSNALASFTATTVTNNVASGITFTLDATLTESPTNFYTKIGLNAFTDGFAVSTTTVSGAFNYRVELETTSDLKVMIGISTDGTNRAWNTAPAWNFAAYNNQGDTTQIRVLSNGSPQTVFTPPVSAGAGNYLEVRRDASDNVTMWYGGVQYDSAYTVSGAVYLHFQQYANGNTVNNPELY